jgi:hypothetical protein
MRDHVLTRLDELKHQYQLGEGQLRELGRQEAALRETLLRIAGAIQVLEELLSSPAAQPAPQPPAPAAPQVPPEEQGRRAQEIIAAQDGNRETYEPLTVP